MIEKIDSELCTGCGICVNSCATDVIRMDETTKKAVIAYKEDCSLCCMCEFDCPTHAIYVSPSWFTPIPTCFGL
jgi:NAD-dependent dihydropyrimidine dehydrogenase PreA subunit